MDVFTDRDADLEILAGLRVAVVVRANELPAPCRNQTAGQVSVTLARSGCASAAGCRRRSCHSMVSCVIYVKLLHLKIREIRISATELARKAGEILGKVRFRRDTFIIERNGRPVARLIPSPLSPGTTLAEGLQAWRAAAPADPDLADDLERVNRSDRPPRDPWAS